MDGCLSLQPWELQLLHRTITSLANTIDQKTTKPSMLRLQPALAILTIASSCLSISPSLHLSTYRRERFVPSQREAVGADPSNLCSETQRITTEPGASLRFP